MGKGWPPLPRRKENPENKSEQNLPDNFTRERSKVKTRVDLETTNQNANCNATRSW